MLKRICAFCLTFALIFSLVVITPVYAAGASEVQLLSDLGIISLTQKSGLIQKGFNRSEFARALCAMAKIEAEIGVLNEPSKVNANDIESDANYKAIATILSLGYMETDIDGNFNPGKPLTEKDAVYALISLLGYKPLVQRNGDNEASYYAMAHKLNLFKNVEIANSEKMTAAETASVLANAMGVKIFAPESVDLGGTCLWERWQLAKSSGRILANSNLGLVTEKTSFKRVNIEGKIYYTELLIPDEYVGSTVTYYTMPSDMGTEVVSISVDKSSEFIALDASDIESVTDLGKELEIIYDNDEELTISKNSFVIVNGKTQSPTKKLFDAFKSGTVTFVDSDSDGEFDLVHMTLMIQNVIDGIYPEFETLTTRYYGEKIELKNFDNYEIYLGGKTADISELMAGMTVGVSCDAFTINADSSITYDFAKAKYIKLYASLRSVEGFVDMIDDETVTVAEMDQPFGEAYYRLIKDKYISAIVPGDYATVYLDAFGEVVYYEVDLSKSSLSYGYLIAADGKTTGLNSITKVKIMDTNGIFHMLESNSKFVLDGKKVESGNTSYTVSGATIDLTKRQLVRFRGTEGKLYELDTAKVVQSDNSLSEDLKFDPYVSDNSAYEIRSGAVDRQFAFKDDCVLFVDEADMADKNPSEYLFTVGKMDADKVEYYMAGYDSDDDNRLNCVVRWTQYGAKEGDSITSPFSYHKLRGHIVEKVTRGIGKDGVEGWYLSVASYSGQSSYFASSERLKIYTVNKDKFKGDHLSIYKCNMEDIKSGDIIRFETDTLGNITFIEKIFDFESHKDGTTPYGSGSHTYGFANLKKISGDYLIYNFDGVETDGIKTDYIGKKKFSLVPLYNVKTGKVKMIDVAELPSQSTGNTVKAFLRDYDHGYMQDHIFYLYE
ncbi:MAG: S-layer homology domain-containing protein [Clostridia bacterium]|nr:S-layer homology domain-containing protein [Clostridia bacterium]